MVRIKLVAISVIHVLAVFLNPNHTFIKLNLEYFIAKRLINAKDYKSSISAPIIKLRFLPLRSEWLWWLCLWLRESVCNKKSEKNFAFNGHIIISNNDNNQSEVALVPISKKQDFYPKFDVVEGQPYSGYRQ
jgi:lipoprotein-releasing system permease protein